MGGGAWPFLVGGAICLVNSDNERDLVLVVACIYLWYMHGSTATLGGEPREDRGNNRSVMPFDVLGRTRATLLRAPGLPLGRTTRAIGKTKRDGD